MGDDKAVQKLIETFSSFYIVGRPVEEDLTFSLTSEFLRNIRNVWFTKQLIAYRRCGHVFTECLFNEATSPEMYLAFVISACRQYASMHLSIYERFLSMFAFLIHLRQAIIVLPAVNLSKLISDIFMALYESELKKSFRRRGGFQCFVEYVNNPKYLAANYVRKDVRADVTEEDLDKLVDRILSEVKDPQKDCRLKDILIDRPNLIMAQKILKTIKVELKSFPIDTEQKANLPYSHKQIGEKLSKKRVLEVKERDLEKCLNSDSETNDDVGQRTDKAKYEKIIQAVIKYNQSKSSDHEETNNPLQKEARGILEHLKGKIKSLIELLDEYDNE